MYKFTDELYEAIEQEASRRFRNYCKRKYTQTVTMQDSLEYWVAFVTYEFVTNGIVR